MSARPGRWPALVRAGRGLRARPGRVLALACGGRGGAPPARWLLLVLASAALSACAYYNSLYNARRSFADAERARVRGDAAGATAAYRASLARAAASYRRDSTGRWSDEALELVGLSRFWLGEDTRAAAAFERALGRGVRGERRAREQAYLGAALARAGRPGPALPYLDSAVVGLDGRSDQDAFARLWRARARFASADTARAWADLDAARAQPGGFGLEAGLEAAARAVAARDSARAAAAFAGLLDRSDAAARADSLRALARAAVAAFDPAAVRAFLAPAAPGHWPAAAALDLALFRASLAAAGDTIDALAEAMHIAASADPTLATRARLSAARWRIAAAGALPAAVAVASALRTIGPDPEATRLLAALDRLDGLASRAAAEPLALFAAAELARDQLDAPLLARGLFLAYAERAPAAVWAPKALLAAASLADGPARDSIRERLAIYEGNVYVRASTGASVDSSFTVAESDLARALRGLGSGAVSDTAALGRRDTAKVALPRKPDTMSPADTASSAAGIPGRNDRRGAGRDTVR